MRLWPRREPAPDIAAIAREAAAAGAQEALVQVAAMRSATEELTTLARQQVPAANSPRVYLRDHPWTWAAPTGMGYRPRQLVTVEMMREFSVRYDPARAMINYIKDHVKTVPLVISAADEDDTSDATERRVQEVEDWFEIEGGLGGPNTLRYEFESQVIEDWHVIGPCAVYLEPSRGGGISSAIAIDAATIRPRVDGYGWPGPGEDWYEQYVDGMRQRGFTAEELYWHGWYPRSDSPYPDSPCEYLVLTVLAAMAADTWNREWLTNGTEPGKWIAMPPDMPPAVAQEWLDIFYGEMEGNTRRRQQLHIFPGGVSQPTQASRRDQEFELMSENLMRRCSAIFGVQLASIGFPQGQYATTQEKSVQQTEDVGVGKVLFHLQALYNYILRRNGYRDLKAEFKTAKEEDATSRAERIQKLTGVPVWTPNRGLEELGDDPLPPGVGDVLWVPNTYVPAEQAAMPPESAPASLPATAPGEVESSGDQAAQQQQRAALKLWERKALNRLKRAGTAACDFEHPALALVEVNEIGRSLRDCETPEAVRAVFASAVENLEDLFPPVYHTSAQQWERRQIAAKWAARRLAAEREA